MAKNTYDAIVVGAGFGGSSCAGLLAKRGLEVLLVEKNARAGGKAMSISKGGYTYTGGWGGNAIRSMIVHSLPSHSANLPLQSSGSRKSFA